MNEGIVSRVSRLISGSVNALVDKAESISPEIVMKETIREIDSTIDEVKVSLGKETIDLKKSKSQLDNEKNKYDNLKEQIKVAIKENRDDLAKSAISRQMDIETQIPILEETVSQIELNIKKYEDFIDALNAKKREMQNELAEFIKINKEQQESSSISNNMQKAQEAFDRVNNIEVESKYLDKDDIELAQLDKLVRDNRIEERLQSLKAEQK
ncbi:PspA/IM30 family protein [Halarcobacter sp.]|uniref:PspA/IM30 family protein n=1 Tax=Halarcobacter sp. TaxID=2321133 RepID=UPI0029F519FD|nr:PspA/IM30 family protein [Halarcobacter sp.]